MKRPAFQFYPADWRNNAKLRRCSDAARGAWIDALCLLHDADEYGVLRWSLAEIARAAGVPLKLLRELAAKDVLKGADRDAPDYWHTPRHAGKDGERVLLVEAGTGPCWYCSRFVRDEWMRARQGGSTRFTPDNQPNKPPNGSPTRRLGERQGDDSGERLGDGASSASASTASSSSPTPPQASTTSPARGGNAYGEAAAKLQAAGRRITSANPDLIAAINEGVHVATILEFAALYPAKPIGYSIGAARRQHAEQAHAVPAGKPRSNGHAQRAEPSPAYHEPYHAPPRPEGIPQTAEERAAKMAAMRENLPT